MRRRAPRANTLRRLCRSGNSNVFSSSKLSCSGCFARQCPTLLIGQRIFKQSLQIRLASISCTGQAFPSRSTVALKLVSQLARRLGHDASLRPPVTSGGENVPSAPHRSGLATCHVLGAQMHPLRGTQRPSAARPNHSLNRSPNGKPPGPFCGISLILHSPGLASRRWRPVSSNVRPHQTCSWRSTLLNALLGVPPPWRF